MTVQKYENHGGAVPGDAVSNGGFNSISNGPETPQINTRLVAFKKWMFAASRLSRSSATTYAYALQSFARSLGKDPADATEEEIYDTLYRLGQEENYSPRYLYLIRIALRRYFQWAKLEKKVQIESKKLAWIPPKPPDEEQINNLVKRCQTAEELALILTLYSTGCRISELLKAKIEDIDWNVPPSFLVVGKGQKPRRIKMLLKINEATNALKAHIGNRKSGPIFLLTRNRAWRMVRRVGKRAGIYLRPHLLRHAHATRMLELTRDIGYVKEDLGHATLQATSVYIHLLPRHETETEKKILELEGGGKRTNEGGE